jgi:paraquat-inducible protein A
LADPSPPGASDCVSEPDRLDAGAFRTESCPACHQQFTISPTQRQRFLCPHCHAPLPNFAPPPTSSRTSSWKSNANAGTLALISEIVLVVAVLLPFMSIVKFGETETYSLVGGIGQLWEHGEIALALIIGAFSLVFPLVKNAMLIAATTTLLPLTAGHRHTLHAVAAKTAKYSMLDVFVVAVLVVVVKLGKATEVAVRSGTFLFCVAIALSMAASACVRLEARSGATDER